MSYRDPLQASLNRLDALQRELDQRVQRDATTEAELTQLREDLRVARKEVDRLRSQIPSAKQARKPFQASLLIFVGLALATAVAGYHSESAGVRMSYVASAPLGFASAACCGASTAG